jgi:PII-like signaling protein
MDTEDAVLLRIYVGEEDRHGGRSLHEALVMKAREMGLAGATVLRGALGYGRSSRVHTAKILRLSEDLPLVLEIVDDEEQIQTYLDQVEEMIEGALVTLERVRVVRTGGSGS